MYDFIFGGACSHLIKRDSAYIDNVVFRLHYRGTVALLLAAFCVVTSEQFIGNPINCMTDSMSSGIMDSYCWIHSTFSVVDNFDGKIGEDYSYPGVAPLRKDSKVHHHKFYQWVVFVLTLQAGMFYLPRFIWKSYEGGVVKLLTNGLTDITAFMDSDTKSDGISRIEKFFRTYGSERSQYFLVFVLCEMLNFVNVIGQIFFMDRFLGYQFSTYGVDVLTQTEGNFTSRGDELNRVFPKVAKCLFKKFGVSGNVQQHDALCVLPLNIINEKIYVAFWFWFVFLSAITGAALIYRLATIFSLELRIRNLYAKAGGLVKKETISAALRNPEHGFLQRQGDYLMLYLLTRNLNPLIVKDMYAELAPEKYGATEEELEALKKSNNEF